MSDNIVAVGNTPIFERLVEEFKMRGIDYQEIVKPIHTVAPTTGVRLKRVRQADDTMPLDCSRLKTDESIGFGPDRPAQKSPVVPDGLFPSQAIMYSKIPPVLYEEQGGSKRVISPVIQVEPDHVAQEILQNINEAVSEFRLANPGVSPEELTVNYSEQSGSVTVIANPSTRPRPLWASDEGTDGA